MKYGVYQTLNSKFVAFMDGELPQELGYGELLSAHDTIEAACAGAGLRSGPEFPHCTCGANACCAGVYGPPPHSKDCALSQGIINGTGVAWAGTAGTFKMGASSPPSSGSH